MYQSDRDRLQNRAVAVNVSIGDNNLVKLTLKDVLDIAISALGIVEACDNSQLHRLSFRPRSTRIFRRVRSEQTLELRIATLLYDDNQISPRTDTPFTRMAELVNTLMARIEPQAPSEVRATVLRALQVPHEVQVEDGTRPT
jgi:hypothetical protein